MRSVILILLFPLLETEPKVESIVGVDDGHSNPPPPHDEKETELSFVRTDVQPSPRTKVLLLARGR